MQGVNHAAARPLLSLTGVSKRFGATLALDGVSIDFHPGEIHCLLGENGAGKSTIGKIIGGLYTPDEGELRIGGETVTFKSIKDSRARGLAMVFQELSLAPDLSVRANLRLGRPQAWRLRHAREAEEAREILARLGCRLDVERAVKSLPVGAQQMVEIAKALLQAPDLIVLDEPTAMLGAAEKARLFAVLRGLRDAGKALVLVTHHVDDVLALADRVSIMRNGRLVDSFAMVPGMRAEQVLDRLTGGRLPKAMAAGLRLEERGDVLCIEGARKRGGGSEPIRVRRGEIVGLYGVVGCGAERLIQALAGAARDKALRLTLAGLPYAPRQPAQAAARGVAYLPAGRASNGIFASLSIRENLSLSILPRLGRYGFVSGRAERQEAERALARFGVKYSDMDAPITGLSGGNQQKVLMARAMAAARHVLVLEEPTAGIDIAAKLSLHERVRELAQNGVAVVMLSSDLIETIQLCDSVITFYEGEVARRYDRPTLDDQADIVADVLGQPH
ncbi:sugar ABC transporter ATP-binding protein [Bordetella hinzii]|uniref:sugar ABC transporter ATP-binding protein n=1 Tax=Bordetella hinzii TaxID=103855 RepID=UPI0005BD4401|nr:sugar ABC transporter ATP-binding protein [Bordetella hinzii]QII85367.1 sugar ABC transporter ATP-binding protein [Bordetella hinzii]QWF38798.1 sugar ABC transporter ATP-binding protein [Bordetella hinzii]QWF43342.1 sugar ABC transporter ATP-binding protein [Bordetella hinzii]QWF47883.1 sugar ABC transporter ATP-binding protein [Bordetella hinzii]QWF52419.1 sugar ABC transporter ATP-binding protein [Bordetella hinzii]